MAKIVWKTTPKAAYEWIEVEGGGTMSHAELAALKDEYVEEHGLVPVESEFVGEVPTHRYGRYKAAGLMASALAPAPLPGTQDDLVKMKAELDRYKADLARAQDQLGKLPKSKQADIVEGDGEHEGMSVSGGAQTTEEARATLNTQDGVNLVGGSEEVRRDMSTADRSDDNPVRRGRPPRGA